MSGSIGGTVVELPARPQRSLSARFVRVLGSFGLACTLFLLLFLVVLIGTLQQRVMSLHDVQGKYFESVFFVLDVFGVPLPFPGGMLLLAVLLVNLVTGGILRMRWGKTTVGILVTHVGIIVLLVGSTIEYLASEKGHFVVFEGESTDAFESYTDWELAVYDVAGEREWVIPQAELERAHDGAGRRFTSPDLPFELRVSGYARNTSLRAARNDGEGAEGVVVVAKAPDPEKAEGNLPGAYVDVRSSRGATSARGVLWGSRPQGVHPRRGEIFGAVAPFTTESDGRTWAFDLRRRRWRLPYEVRLTKAVQQRYPGTDMASEFSSYVKVISSGVSRDAHITMNEPLRDRGHTLYQSAFNQFEDGRIESGLAVVHNPTDRVPLIACLIIAGGMLLHFVVKLARYLSAQSKMRAVVAEAAA